MVRFVTLERLDIQDTRPILGLLDVLAVLHDFHYGKVLRRHTIYTELWFMPGANLLGVTSGSISTRLKSVTPDRR